ncbi:uncharacterized protein SAPINGB_P000800 [Magnusiomyces paraingens]|uniref:COX assembly mitochondrial protein n=1 Tax=Magnusiomyces paraingens TaxID=2606893 RepID=A0A5E8B2Y9_9ASCO|nr:uncharacterized protein SAPINGB_P000800 [Saprochaete ingens]VVT45579.1 unnamed protein product [Saprochaete ingens]
MSSTTNQQPPSNITEEQKQKTDEHGVPLWILAPTEEKTLLKEHQAWTEKMCEKEFSNKKEAMVQCVAHYGSPAMFNKLREAYIERKISYREKLDQENKTL